MSQKVTFLCKLRTVQTLFCLDLQFALTVLHRCIVLEQSNSTGPFATIQSWRALLHVAGSLWLVLSPSGLLRSVMAVACAIIGSCSSLRCYMYNIISIVHFMHVWLRYFAPHLCSWLLQARRSRAGQLARLKLRVTRSWSWLGPHPTTSATIPTSALSGWRESASEERNVCIGMSVYVFMCMWVLIYMYMHVIVTHMNIWICMLQYERNNNVNCVYWVMHMYHAHFSVTYMYMYIYIYMYMYMYMLYICICREVHVPPSRGGGQTIEWVCSGLWTY